MDRLTAEAISSVMSYFSTPVSTAPVTVNAFEGKIFEAA